MAGNLTISLVFSVPVTSTAVTASFTEILCCQAVHVLVAEYESYAVTRFREFFASVCVISEKFEPNICI